MITVIDMDLKLFELKIPWTDRVFNDEVIQRIEKSEILQTIK